MSHYKSNDVQMLLRVCVSPRFLPLVQQDGNDNTDDEDDSQHGPHDPDQTLLFIDYGLWVDISKHHWIRVRARRIQHLKENPEQ